MRFEDVKAHDVLCGVMQHQAEKIKFNDRVQADGKVVEERGEIALLRNSLAHFEQGFELTPGVLQRGSLRHFRRRDDTLRHKTQDNTGRRRVLNQQDECGSARERDRS